jgi:hypothetical protein
MERRTGTIFVKEAKMTVYNLDEIHAPKTAATGRPNPELRMIRTHKPTSSRALAAG